MRLLVSHTSCAAGVAQHRQQIHSKLVNIMRERLSTSLKALHATSTSWAAYNPGTTPLNGAATPRTAPAGTPQKPAEMTRFDSMRGASPAKPRTVAKMMLQIARQVTTLHEALAPVMSQSQQAEIGMRVRRMYSEALARFANDQPTYCSCMAAQLGCRQWFLVLPRRSDSGAECSFRACAYAIAALMRVVFV